MNTIELKCTYCGRSYNKLASKSENSKYCSRDCFDKKAYMLDLGISCVQILASSVLGDGCLYKAKSANYHKYSTNSKYLEYIKYKSSLVAPLKFGSPNGIINNGFSKTTLYQFATQPHPKITEIALEPLDLKLLRLNELGVALSFFDNGSLHQKKGFYNLNTHRHDKETHIKILIPYFEDVWALYPKLGQERKKDGRHFFYLRFGVESAKKVNEILKEFEPSNSIFKYKTFK